MKKLFQEGFSAIELLLVIVIVGILGFTGWYVYNAQKKVNVSYSPTSSGDPKFKKVSKLNTIAATNAKVIQTGTTSTPVTSSTSTQKATTSNTKSTNSSSSSNGSSANSGSSQTGGSSTTTQTPLSALIAIITSLDNGSGFANVTSSSITVPGPISNAQARPIVFSVSGQTYFAYTQEQKPDFNTSASQTANSMAIVTATVSNPALTQAYLDKSGILVDANSEAVGYSSGGD